MPNIKVLLQILATLPVATAEPERVFSRVKQTATAVRNMEEKKLEALILLQSHLDRTPSTEDVLNKFAAAEARRLKFVLSRGVRSFIYLFKHPRQRAEATYMPVSR